MEKTHDEVLEEARVSRSKCSIYDKLCQIISVLNLSFLGIVLTWTIIVIIFVDDASFTVLLKSTTLKNFGIRDESLTNTSSIGDEPLTNSSRFGAEIETFMKTFGGLGGIIMKVVLLVIVDVMLSFMALQVFLLVGATQRSLGYLWFWVIVNTTMWLAMCITAVALHEITFTHASIGVQVGILALAFPILLYIVVQRIQEIQVDVRDNLTS